MLNRQFRASKSPTFHILNVGRHTTNETYSNMIRVLKLLLVNLICVISLNGQTHTTSIDFDSLGKQIELHQKDLGDLQSLIIKNSTGDVIKTISIDKEYDPYHFKDFYQGQRNFAIIGGRYKFYIVNVSNNKLIGPFSACCRIEAEDAQTGVLYAYKIIKDGQYLLVNALDNGLTCFSLLDLYNPKEVDFFKFDSIYFKGNYVFIDKRKENIFNGISAECGNYNKEIDYKVLFHGCRFEIDSSEKLKYMISDKKLLTLKQIVSDSIVKDFRVDLESGLIINGKE